MIADEMKVDKVQTGKRIKKLMDEKGDTVLTLSQITGLSKSAIRNYINGKNPPSLQNLGVIADIYSVNISEIVVYRKEKYSLQGTTQGRYLTGGVPPVRFSM